MRTLNISARTAERLRRQTLSGTITGLRQMSDGRYEVSVTDETFQRIQQVRWKDETISEVLTRLCDEFEGVRPS